MIRLIFLHCFREKPITNEIFLYFIILLCFFITYQAGRTAYISSKVDNDCLKTLQYGICYL